MTGGENRNEILQLQGVSKQYGATIALREATLTVGAGERIALVGHNGAGKTTLLRLMLGLARPDRGTISVLGAQPGSVAARQRCAYLPEWAAFHALLTGREQLNLYAQLRGVTLDVADVALDRVGLTMAANRRVATYSRGMRQRLGLAQAILGNPQLLLLDEPTGGLDPDSRQYFYRLVHELAQQGTATVLSSHALNEIEEQVDRLMILQVGRIVATGTPAELRRNARLPVTVRFVVSAKYVVELRRQLAGRAGVAVLSDDEPSSTTVQSVEVDCHGLAEKVACINAVTRTVDEIVDIQIRPPSFATVYQHYMQEASVGKPC